MIVASLGLGTQDRPYRLTRPAHSIAFNAVSSTDTWGGAWRRRRGGSGRQRNRLRGYDLPSGRAAAAAAAAGPSAAAGSGCRRNHRHKANSTGTWGGAWRRGGRGGLLLRLRKRNNNSYPERFCHNYIVDNSHSILIKRGIATLQVS